MNEMITKLIKEKYSHYTGVVITQNENVVYENYFNGCDKSHKAHVFSVTKSVVSLLIGIAIDLGYIQNLDEKICRFFPDDKVNETVSIKDLMSMHVKFKYKVIGPYSKYFKAEDKVAFSLKYMREPFAGFKYLPLIGPDILTGILEATTGMTVLNFAKRYLFEPLEIQLKDSIYFASKEEQMTFYDAHDFNGWVADACDHHTAGWGLTLSASDLSKLGILCLNNGLYRGQRIVSEKWIKTIGLKHNQHDKLPLNYGLMWWLLKDESMAAMGDGGNMLYVNQSKKLIIAITADFKRKIPLSTDFVEDCISQLNL